MKLKNIIEYLDNNKSKIEDKLNNLKNIDPKDVKDLMYEKKLNTDYISNLANIIVSNNESKLETIVSNLTDDNKTIEDIKLNGINLFVDSIKKDNPDIVIPSISSLTSTESIDKLKDILSDTNNKKLFDECIKKSYSSYFLSNFKNRPLEIYNKIESSLNGVENIEKEYDKIIPITERKRDYKYVDEDIFIDLKNENKTSKSLDYVKENVLKRRDSDSVNSDSLLAEDIPSYQKRPLFLNIPKNDFFNKYLEYNGSTISYKIGINKIEDKNKLDQELEKNEIKITDKKQEIIFNTLNMMDSMKDYKTNKSLFDLDSYHLEESSKVYAFKNFYNLDEVIRESIKNKDIKNIDRLKIIHETETKKMDSLINSLDKLDTDYYPANISISRNESMPVKYCEDFKSASMVNGLWHFNALIKYTNLDPKEFLKNPVKTYINFLNKNKDLNEINELGKNGDIDFIKNLTNPKTKSSINKQLMNKYNNFRAFEFIASTDKDNYKNNFYTYQYMKQTKIMDVYSDKSKDLNNIYTNLGPDKFKNIILNQNPNVKYTDLLSNNYDASSYLKENEIDTVKFINKINLISENIGSFNGKDNEIKEGIKLASLELLKSKDLSNSINFTSICQNAGIENYKAIRFNANSKDIAPYVKNEYEQMTKEGINSDNIAKAVNSLKAVNDQFKKRTVFGRVFRSEGRAEKRLISQIKNDIISSGIPENKIDDMLNNKTPIEYFIKNIQDKDNKIVNESKKHIVINELENNLEDNKSYVDREKINVNNLDKNITIDENQL